MTRPLRLWSAVRGREGGQALLFVLISVTLLASIPIAIATTTVNQQIHTARNLNYEAAYEAAQAGLNDYIQHLDANEAYGIYSKANPPTPANPAFTSWVQAATVPVEYYSYAPTNNSGVISLKVSGRSGTGSTAVVRTFTYTVKPASSLNDVYWTNYETIDPVVAATENGLPSDTGYCATHYGEPSTDSYPGGSGGTSIPANGPPDDCIVQFYTGDVLNGPVFSNDSFRMCGTPQFLGSVQSGNIYSPSVWVTSPNCGGTASPTFSGPAPTKVSNESPRTSSDDLVPARTYGCFITGGTSPSSLTPTNVTMTLSVTGTAPNQTTTVTWSGSGGTIVDNAAGNSNNCASGLKVSNLTSGLIFVNGNVTISGQMTGGLDIVTCSTNIETSCNSTTPSNITIANSLTYPAANITNANGQPTSDATDSLGLIAQNSVIVTEVNNIQIDAAILALQDSFYVNNWFSGSFGTLNVFGAIAENFRGPVGTSAPSGYAKNYNYDTSLRTLFPPYFIPPNGATWAATSYAENSAGLTNSVCPAC